MERYKSILLKSSSVSNEPFNFSNGNVNTLFHLKYYTMLGIDSIDENTNRISFIVTFKQKSKLLSLKKNREFSRELDSKVELLSDVQKIAYISNIKVIDGSNSVEI